MCCYPEDSPDCVNVAGRQLPLPTLHGGVGQWDRLQPLARRTLLPHFVQVSAHGNNSKWVPNTCLTRVAWQPTLLLVIFPQLWHFRLLYLFGRNNVPKTNSTWLYKFYNLSLTWLVLFYSKHHLILFISSYFLQKNRKEIPCYWESQAAGCQKPHCAFLHERPRTIEGTFFPADKSEFTLFIQIDLESKTVDFAVSRTHKYALLLMCIWASYSPFTNIKIRNQTQFYTLDTKMWRTLAKKN